MFCLPFEQTKKFIKALKEGAIDPAKLSEMTSAERRGFFEKLIGKEDAQSVNALFESKLLLKNQQQGMIQWAKTVGGIKEAVRRDLISKIEKLDRVLTAKDQESFLQDLASTKLGTDISFNEAKQLSELSGKFTEARANLDNNSPIGSPSRLEYGAKRVAVENYVNDLKLGNKESALSEILNTTKKNPLKGGIKAISNIAGIAKGIKASLDDSAIFRQGWRTLFTNPSSWAKNALNSFENIYKQLGKKASNNDIIDGIKADIYSRPNAVDDTYKKMKLDIGIEEEAFPTTLPEKIPLFGRLYKASETAYKGFLYRMRADIADKYIKIAKDNGVDLTDKMQLESIGKLVNSLTGRGNLGAFEKVAKEVNTIFFSPKMAKSAFDFLTLHAADTMSTFARKQAAINLLKVVAGTAAIMATARALDPKSVELDPRSSDFGKIRIGDTRFDITGGMGSLAVLGARLMTGATKSTSSGIVTQLDSGKFGSPTRKDVMFNYLENKYSPFFSVLKDIRDGKDFNGNKPTVLNETNNLLTPLPITNAASVLNDPNGANALLTIIADALGISTNTYAPQKKKK